MARTAPKPKLGRPPLPPGQARHHYISLPVSELEREKIRAAARAAGKNLADYLRSRIRIA